MHYIKVSRESKKVPGKILTACMPIFNEEFERLTFEGTSGFCLNCGHQADGIEPDARKYECETCGKERLYGLEELLLMGLVVTRELQAQEHVYES
jgi:DNA-directed RNA polymerase subunit RPC12/RpoP